MLKLFKAIASTSSYAQG